MTNKVETDVMYFKDDVGKNLYRKTTYYTLKIEQDVLAKDKDEADKLFSDGGGINHSKVGKDLTDANDGVETYMVDANYTDSDTTKYLGKVKWDTDSYNQSLEEAKENLDIHIDTWADENEPLQVEAENDIQTDEQADKIDEQSVGDFGVDYGTKEESDIDTSIQLEAESKRGK